jgi:hypothetical protein
MTDACGRCGSTALARTTKRRTILLVCAVCGNRSAVAASDYQRRNKVPKQQIAAPLVFLEKNTPTLLTPKRR